MDGIREFDVAVVGMSLRLPGAATPEAFWRNLAAGVDAVTRDLPEPKGLDAAGGHYVGAEGVLDGADEFDADFFGFSPAEAAWMDPQHRVLLTCCWEALEHAGYAPESCPRLTAVYVGCGANTYLLEAITNGGEEPRDSLSLAIGNEKDYAATRIAYKLNLRGPAISVQSACSSSLAAVHLGCQALLAGDADLAVAGGAAIRFPLRRGYVHREGTTLAADGTCRPFDARAGGTVPGNGAGVVVLKRLEDAVAADDPILGVLRGSAVNNDGAAKVGYTAPSARAQADVMRRALAHAEVDPDDVDYVETHGTGTDLGDRIEATALLELFGDRTRPCLIGALKSSIGHLEAAAGVAGLIKTLLAIERRQVPPTLHFSAPNETLGPARGLEVVTSLREWPRPAGEPCVAGVSSFGIGGTNVHLVVGSAPQRVRSASQPSRGSAPPLEVLPLSARRSEAVAAAASALAEHLRDSPDGLADVAFTLQEGRRPFEYRRAFVAAGPEEASERVVAAAAEPVRAASPSLAFVFPAGEVPAGAGLALAAVQPRFRSALDECRSGLAGLGQTELSGAAATFAVQWATATLLVESGLLPAAVVGQGAGCLAAATFAGVLGLDDALRVVQALEAGREASLEELLAGLPLRAPRLPLACGLADGWAGAGATSPSFWVEQLTGDAPLDAAVAPAASLSGAVLVGIGSLAGLGPSPEPPVRLEAMPRPGTGHEERDLLEAVARAWEHGAAVTWETLRRPGGRRVKLPGYPFERRRHTVLDAPTRAAVRPPEDEQPESTETAVYLEGWRPFVEVPRLGELQHIDALVVGEAADAEQLTRWIAARGGSTTLVAPVERGENPDAARAFVGRLEPLLRGRARGGRPIPVFLVPAAGEPRRPEGVTAALATLLALAQAVDRVGEPVRIVILTRGAAPLPGRAYSDPLHALLVGAAKAVPLDVRHASLAAVERGSDSEPDLAAAVAYGLAPDVVGEHGFRLLAVAAGGAWTETYEAVDPADLPPAPALPSGSYVIFGAGKGGLLAAEYLARTVRSPFLALASPSATRGRLAEPVQELEALGATVGLYDCDVTDADAVEGVRAEAERHAPVRGVVQAVGHPRGLLLQASEVADVAEVVLPKAIGVEVLLDVFDLADLELMLLFSSTIARSGAIGHFSYGAGNSYLDAVAWRAAAAGNPRVTTVAWPIFRWTDVADDIAPELQTFLRGLREERGLDREEAFGLLERLPVAGFPAVTVAVEDPLRTAERHRGLASRFWSEIRGAENGQGAQMGSAETIGLDEALAVVCGVWQQALGVPSVAPEDEFIMLGGHSLLLVQIIGGIREAFGVEVPVQLAYRASTPAAQAALVVELAAGGVPEELRAEQVGGGPA